VVEQADLVREGEGEEVRKAEEGEDEGEEGEGGGAGVEGAGVRLSESGNREVSGWSKR
jgi:hypothetical protein